MYFNQNSKPALHYVLHSLIPKPKSSQRKALFQFWVPDKLLMQALFQHARNVSAPIHKTS